MTRPSTSLILAVAAHRRGRGGPARRLLAVVAAVTGLVVVAPLPVAASAAEYQRMVRVNLSSTGAQVNTNSDVPGVPAISAHGRYVAFLSSATNLVPADTNNDEDVFVRDVATGRTRRVSSGVGIPAISADGRYVAFNSGATNLVPGDTNSQDDVFVRDMATGKTRRVNVSSTGAQANGNGYRYGLAMSADGRHVAFSSSATNLVPADTNNTSDVFVRDTATGKTRRVTVSSTGAQADAGMGLDADGWLALSVDGRHVAFSSKATNLVPADTNNTYDVFVHDVTTGKTRRVSVSSTGAQGNGESWHPTISADGRHVAFDSTATNLVPADTNNIKDVFVRDMATGKTRRIAERSWGPTISADGRHIAFTGLTNYCDVFVHDMATGQTRQVSISSTDVTGDYFSLNPAISADGRHVAFWSGAGNLVADDTNGSGDVFLRHLTN